MRILLFCFVIFFVSCNTESASNDPVAALEEEVSNSPTNANVTQLLAVYDSIVTTSSGGATLKETLNKQYALAKRHIRLADQISALQHLILEFPDDAETAQRKYELGNAYRQTRRPVAAKIVLGNFSDTSNPTEEQKSVLDEVLSDPRISPDTLVKMVGSQMFGAGSMRINSTVARSYVDACMAYAVVYDGKSESAENLHKAAETARSLGEMDEALMMYDWIIERYPDHPRTPQALFLKAFTYDSDMKEFDKARQYYTEFMEKYPENDFAKSAEFLLENLGKDDEELLQILQEKAAEQ